MLKGDDDDDDDDYDDDDGMVRANTQYKYVTEHNRIQYSLSLTEFKSKLKQKLFQTKGATISHTVVSTLFSVFDH